MFRPSAPYDIDPRSVARAPAASAHRLRPARVVTRRDELTPYDPDPGTSGAGGLGD